MTERDDHFLPSSEDDSEQLWALYTMHCAVAHHPDCKNKYQEMKYPAFSEWWQAIDLETRDMIEDRLRQDYRQVLKDSVTSGMDVVKRYLKPDQPKASRRFTL